MAGLLRTPFDRTVTLLEELTGEPRWVGDYDILIKIRMSRGSIACDVVGLPPHLNLGYEIDCDRGHQDALHSILGFETGIEKFSVLVDVLGKYKPNGNGVGDHALTGSFGDKWNLFKQFVMFLNFHVPLNEQGLRSNVITTVGAEYTF